MKVSLSIVFLFVASVMVAGQTSTDELVRIKNNLAKTIKDSGNWSKRGTRSKVTDAFFRGCTLVVEREDISKNERLRQPDFMEENQVSAALEPTTFRVENTVTEIDLSSVSSPVFDRASGIIKDFVAVRIRSASGQDFVKVKRTVRDRKSSHVSRDVAALVVRQEIADAVQDQLKAVSASCSKIG